MSLLYGDMRGWQSILFLAWLIGACFIGACSSGGDGLGVSGDVRAMFPDGTESGFNFDEGRDLPSGGVTGSCEIGSAGGLALEVSREAGGEGRALNGFQLTFDSASDAGTITARFGSGDVSASTGEGCSIDVLYQSADDGTAAVSFDCQLGGSADDGAVAGELHFSGCEGSAEP